MPALVGEKESKIITKSTLSVKCLGAQSESGLTEALLTTNS